MRGGAFDDRDARPRHSRTRREGAPKRCRTSSPETFSRETIARYLAESVDLLGDSKLAVFVPVSPTVLRARSAARRSPGRSPAHEGAARRSSSSASRPRAEARSRPASCAPLRRSLRVRSAGSCPSDDRQSRSSSPAMAEIGVDLARAFPKPLTDEVVRAADVVITMGCGDACAIYPGKRYENWDARRPRRARILTACVGSGTRSTNAFSRPAAELSRPQPPVNRSTERRGAARRPPLAGGWRESLSPCGQQRSRSGAGSSAP